MQGAAGAIIIVTLAPVDPSIVNNLFASTQAPETPSTSAPKSEPPQLFIKLIALALIGGYAGRSLLESSASQYARRLEEKIEEDRKLTDKRIEEGRKVVEKKISALEEQSKLGRDAVRLAEQILRRATLSTSEIDEFTRKLQEVSSQVRFVIAHRADENRRQNWENNKEHLEGSLIIFKALTTTDDAKTCHWWYAYLGYCLKDKQHPNYAEALECLDVAIEMRGQETRSGAYEFNRAICNIHLVDRLQDKASKPYRYQQIKKDLDAAEKFARFRDIIKNDATIQKWLSQNNLLRAEADQSAA
jgi:hypothetical protein